MDDTAALSVAQAMISNRVRPKTTYAYRRKLVLLARWLKQQGHAVADHEGDELPALPLDNTKAIAFFGELVKVRSETHPIFGKLRRQLLENGGHVSSATAGG